MSDSEVRFQEATQCNLLRQGKTVSDEKRSIARSFNLPSLELPGNLTANVDDINESTARSIALLEESFEGKWEREDESHQARVSSAESLKAINELLLENQRHNRANTRTQGLLLAVTFATLICAIVGWFI